MNVSPYQLALITLLCGGISGLSGFLSGQEKAPESKPKPVELSAIPDKFEDWQDAEGFTWQLLKSGAVSSGNTPYFQGALGLLINGQAFAPMAGTRLDGGQASDSGAMIELRQKTESQVAVSRQVWFDAARSAVRLLDTFTNESKVPLSFRVDLKTGYQYPWQDLHTSDGRLLGTKPGAGLEEREYGLVVKFSQAEGRHDTLFVTSGERDAVKPVIAFASNNRELTFSYDLNLKPGESASILNWLVQRNLQAAADATRALQPFYSRRLLVRPMVPENLVKSVINFDLQSFPGDDTEPFNLDTLVSLNEVTERIEVDRRNEDVLWISEENQMAGTINPEAKLKIATEYGDRETGISEVAAIEGGGGLGRKQRVFLRNGEVWAGTITATNLSMKIDEGWEVNEIKPEELGAVLCRIGKNDGKPAPEVNVFAEFRNGNVIGLSAGAEGASRLKLLCPWGEDELALQDIRRLFYDSGDTPKFRLEKTDGSILSVFLNGDAFTTGEALKANSSDLVRLWQVGEVFPSNDESGALSNRWMEFADVAAPEDLPSPACLLAGNNLMVGNLKTNEVNLVAEQAVTPVNPAEIVEIRRSLDAGTDMVPVFEVELNSGDVLTGSLRERMLVIESKGREWEVPVQHFIAFRRSAVEGGAQ